MTIDFTFTREYWQDPTKPPVHSDWPFDIDDVDTVVIHYSAAANRPSPEDPGETVEQVAQVLRNEHHYYLTNRGYSYGYSCMVDQWGNSWQVRGTDYRPASNKGDNEKHKHQHDYPHHPNGPDKHNCNRHTFSIQIMVDGNGSAFPAAIEEVRYIVGALERMAGRQLKIVGHQDLDFTPCPGMGVYHQVSNGTFRPVVPDIEEEMNYNPKRLFTSMNGYKTSANGQTLRLGVGSGTRKVSGHIHILEAEEPGHVTVYPAQSTKPKTANMVYQPGVNVSGTFMTDVDDGFINVYVAKPAHIIVDQVATA